MPRTTSRVSMSFRHVRARLWDGMNSAEVSGCSQVRPQPFFNSGGDRVHLLPEVVATVVAAFRRDEREAMHADHPLASVATIFQLRS